MIRPETGLVPTYYLDQEGHFQKGAKTLQESTARYNPLTNSTSMSEIFTTQKEVASIFEKLKNSLERLTYRSRADQIMSMNRAEQDRLREERVTKYGLDSDKVRVARRKQLFRFRRGFAEDNTDKLLEGINITGGLKDIDTSGIATILQNAIEKNMFKAQTGGWFKNLIGPPTMYLGQQSLEKSRAQINGLNQILSDVRNTAEALIAAIQDRESTLGALESSGKARIVDGKVTADSVPEAKIIGAELEESKLKLRAVLADIKAIDDTVALTGNRVPAILRQIGFLSPELMKDNKIVQNLNAGLDKTGKVLKFQTRTAEVLADMFKRMQRYVSQTFKNWMLQLNPLTQIKKLFSDFMSYDVKWRRTMNVIKYNLRRIFRPMMEWIAQQLVNIIGLVNAIIKGVGRVFGKDWDLFDQSAANAEKMREELEQAANVTASFDELHDIGTDSGSSDASMDLLGDIYLPQWTDLYDKIEEAAKKIAEKLIPVFKKLGDILKWCLEHWKLLLGLWAAFKIAKGLLNLLGWAENLKMVLGAIDLIKFANLLSWLSIILGAIIEIKTIWDLIEWDKHYFGVNPEEREENKKKISNQAQVGGTLIGAGIGWLTGGGITGPIIGAEIGNGIAEAIIGAVTLALDLKKGNSEGVLTSAENFGEGIGKAAGTVAGAKLGATIGAAIGSVGGPLGTAVGGILGTVIGGTIGFFAGGGLGKALGNLSGQIANSVQGLIRGSGDFQKLRVDTDDVAEAMQNATDKTEIYNKELDKLHELESSYGVDAERLYNSVQTGSMVYEDLSYRQKVVYDQYANMLTAEQNMYIAKQQNLEVSAKWQEQLAKESGDYSEYIKVLQQGMEDGVISQEKMVDYFAQTYGVLDADAKQVFLNQLPSYLRNFVIEQGADYETFGNKVVTTWNNIKDGVSKGIVTLVDSAKNGFRIMGEGIANAWDNIKTNTAQQWEEIKNSAIGQKVQEIWQGTVNKFNDLKEKLSQKWTEIKDAASQGWQKIKDAVFGWVKSLWEAVTGIFSKIGDAARNLWERVKNFFSGKGFKTNEQVDSSGNKTVEIQPYATGTNYVPSTGLAYLHQGEAVIPAKYNKPYEPYTGNTEQIGELINAVRDMKYAIEQGIPVHGEFTQRGSDLVAAVERASSQMSNTILNKRQFAR